jgi:S-adenosylmethionine synthetase
MFFSNEIVFRGHPDKVADQISDALLDAYLSQDSDSRCGIEVVGGKGKIFVTGEVTSKGDVDVEKVVKSVLNDVGYSKDYEIINNLGQQSPDIAQGVDTGGAGDQGMMFGYACRDTISHVPLAMHILQCLSMYYDWLRLQDPRFLPDGKAQITGCYDENGKLRYIKDFVISYQNTEIDREETDKILIDYCRDLCHQYYISIENFHINPTGKFLIGGFEGDAGLTGRKVVIDNYQGFAPVGGGCFSGKCFTKVDRSAAYKARQLAIRSLEGNSEFDWVQVQLSYAIGIVEPMAIYIKTNKGEYYDLDENIDRLYQECTPARIINDLRLKSVKYYETAKFGHFGLPGFPWEK